MPRSASFVGDIATLVGAAKQDDEQRERDQPQWRNSTIAMSGLAILVEQPAPEKRHANRNVSEEDKRPSRGGPVQPTTSTIGRPNGYGN